MRNTVLLAIIALFLTAFSIVYFTFFRGPSGSQNSVAETPIAEKSAAFIAAPGYVEPVSEEIEVGAEIAGKLRSVAVEEGEQVAKGQIIAVIENGDFETAIETARAQVVTLQSIRPSADARLLQAKTDRERIANGARPEERREAQAAFEQSLPNVENARRELERRERLATSGDISREELDRAKTALQNAQKLSDTMREKYNVVNAGARGDDLAKADAAIKLAAAQVGEIDAQIREANARVREAEARRDKTIVRAPLAGTILRKRLNSGESVSPDSPSGIVTIADTTALRVRIEIDETDVAQIAVGQPAYVIADAFGQKRFNGRVSRVGQILGRKNVKTERPTEKVDTKVLEVLVDLDANEKLPLGLRVDAFVGKN